MISNSYRARRRTLFGGVGAAALAATAACGDDGPAGTSDDPIELSFEWWGNEARADLTQQAIDVFEEKNEGLKVRTNFADYQPYWESLTTRMASQDLPDVFQMDYPRLLQFAGNGMLLPLDDLVTASGFRSGIEETGRVDGELVAVPVGLNTNGLLYRADLFAEHGIEVPEAGYSWDEFAAIIAELSPALGEAKWATDDWTRSYIFLEMWLLQQDTRFYAEDGSGLGFTKEQLIEWWTMNSDQVEADLIPSAASAAELESGGMPEGVIASQIMWASALTGLAPTVEEIGGTLALAPPPAIGPDNLGIFLKPSMQWVVGANSEHPEESAKLIDFLLTDPEALKILGTNRGIPSSDSALDDVEVDEPSQAVIDYIDSVEDHLVEAPPPPPSAAGSVEAKYTEIYEQVSFGDMTPSEAADLYFTEAETLFAAEQ